MPTRNKRVKRESACTVWKTATGYARMPKRKTCRYYGLTVGDTKRLERRPEGRGFKPRKEWMKKGLDRFKGMTWIRAKEELERNAHMLFLGSNDERCSEIVQTYRDYGIEVGMATLVAHLYIDKHGAGSAAVRAVELYNDIANKVEATGKLKDRAQTLRHKLDNLEYFVWFAARGAPKPREWPLRPLWKKLDNLGGLANVMMFLSAKQLEKDGGTCNEIAAGSIIRFLKEGFEEKRKGKAA